MFHNTLGGRYQDNGSISIYTFPDDAAFEIEGVSIPIGGIKIECYGGCYDGESMEYFTNLSSLLLPKKHNIYNTDIFIDDNSTSDHGYPSRNDF